MSLNLPSVPVSKVIDPRLDLNNTRHYVAVKGALVNSWQQYYATNLNDNNVQITANPPNRNIAISRFVLKKFVFGITISGTNTSGGPLLVPGYYASRAFPIACVTSSEGIILNNDTITQSPISQFWPALVRYHNEYDSRFRQLSLTPSMLDQAQQYSDAVNTVRNPLANYFQNSMENTRGGYTGLQVISNASGATSATLLLTVYEPIMVSPFVFGKGSNETSALIDIENIAYSCTLNNLSRVMSLVQNQGAPGLINITSIDVTLDSASLLFEYLTPDPINPIPRSLVSSYSSLVSYPTKTSQSIAAGDSVSITMQSVSLSGIPSKIYLFAREDDSVQNAFSSDCFMSLNPSVNPVTVTWNSNIFMSQATIADLYNVSVMRGCNLSYSQFTNFTGSVLCLRPGLDFGLSSDEAPGLIGQYQLGITAQFTNVRSTAIIPTLYCVVVYEGTFNVINGHCSHMINSLSRSDVLNSTRNSAISFKDAESVYGGDFFSSLKKGLSKAHDFVKDNKLVSRIASLIPDGRAQAVGKFASQFGYGKSGGKLRGGSLNKKITKEELKNRIQQKNRDDSDSDDSDNSDNSDE